MVSYPSIQGRERRKACTSGSQNQVHSLFISHAAQNPLQQNLIIRQQHFAFYFIYFAAFFIIPGLQHFADSRPAFILPLPTGSLIT